MAVVVESSQRELLDALPGNPIIIREGNLVLAFMKANRDSTLGCYLIIAAIPFRFGGYLH
ncbi:hypothetical protein J4731_24580 [Providencia rettgeri]|nr:hypothetical protein [Providencia rettgeri]